MPWKKNLNTIFLHSILTWDNFRTLYYVWGESWLGFLDLWSGQKPCWNRYLTPYGEFRWSLESPVSQIHSPHLHVGTPGSGRRTYLTRYGLREPPNTLIVVVIKWFPAVLWRRMHVCEHLLHARGITPPHDSAQPLSSGAVPGWFGSLTMTSLRRIWSWYPVHSDSPLSSTCLLLRVNSNLHLLFLRPPNLTPNSIFGDRHFKQRYIQMNNFLYCLQSQWISSPRASFSSFCKFHSYSSSTMCTEHM